MPKLPVVTGREMVRALTSAGFSLVRISGSHHYLNRDDINLAVPVHGAKPLPKGLTANLIKQSGLSVDEFTALLK